MINIVAIGSSFNNDAIAWRLLESIEDKLQSLNKKFSIHYCGNPSTQLIHLLQSYTPTILIDALYTDELKSNIIQIKLADLLNETHHFSSHQLSVANVLQLADSISTLPKELWILGIGITDDLFTLKQIDQAKDKLFNEIRHIANGHTGH